MARQAGTSTTWDACAPLADGILAPPAHSHPGPAMPGAWPEPGSRAEQRAARRWPGSEGPDRLPAGGIGRRHRPAATPPAAVRFGR
jgi:hypothetical protein